VEKQKFVIFNSFNNGGLTYQDYVEFCEMERTAAVAEGSEDDK